MMTFEPANTFRGLPLIPGQDSEVRHYIHVRQRSGLPWDTLELHAMLADMLDPPQADEEDHRSVSDSMGMERAAVVLDVGKDLDRADRSVPRKCRISATATFPHRARMIYRRWHG
jgi:hypothetical protein